MSEQEPVWVKGFSAVRENGRWVVPFLTEDCATYEAKIMQESSGVQLKVERCSSGDWDVVEA